MTKPLSQTDLEAYLDEALPPEEMARIEQYMRDDPTLIEQLTTINARRDDGVHSLGEVWRRHRLSCPTREQLGSYLLGILPDEAADYITFHIELIGCRICRANLEDMKARQVETSKETEVRRQKYFQSSAGYLQRSQQ